MDENCFCAHGGNEQEIKEKTVYERDAVLRRAERLLCTFCYGVNDYFLYFLLNRSECVPVLSITRISSWSRCSQTNSQSGWM